MKYLPNIFSRSVKAFCVLVALLTHPSFAGSDPIKELTNKPSLSEMKYLSEMLIPREGLDNTMKFWLSIEGYNSFRNLPRSSWQKPRKDAAFVRAFPLQTGGMAIIFCPKDKEKTQVGIKGAARLFDAYVVGNYEHIRASATNVLAKAASKFSRNRRIRNQESGKHLTALTKNPSVAYQKKHSGISPNNCLALSTSMKHTINAVLRAKTKLSTVSKQVASASTNFVAAISLPATIGIYGESKGVPHLVNWLESGWGNHSEGVGAAISGLLHLEGLSHQIISATQFLGSDAITLASWGLVGMVFLETKLSGLQRSIFYAREFSKLWSYIHFEAFQDNILQLHNQAMKSLAKEDYQESMAKLEADMKGKMQQANSGLTAYQQQLFPFLTALQELHGPVYVEKINAELRKNLIGVKLESLSSRVKQAGIQVENLAASLLKGTSIKKFSMRNELPEFKEALEKHQKKINCLLGFERRYFTHLASAFNQSLDKIASGEDLYNVNRSLDSLLRSQNGPNLAIEELKKREGINHQELVKNLANDLSAVGVNLYSIPKTKPSIVNYDLKTGLMPYPTHFSSFYFRGFSYIQYLVGENIKRFCSSTFVDSSEKKQLGIDLCRYVISDDDMNRHLAASKFLSSLVSGTFFTN